MTSFSQLLISRGGSHVHRPIQRVLVRSIVIFLFSLGVVLSLLSYFALTRLLYSQYEERLSDIVSLIEQNCSEDDLSHCVERGTASRSLRLLQDFLSGTADTFGLEHAYIVIPEEDCMTEVITSLGTDFNAGASELHLLRKSSAYTAEELERYRSFWNAETVGFFERRTENDFYYTAVKPLHDSNGETVALLCLDASVVGLRRDIARDVLYVTLIILLLCGLFGFGLTVWLRRNVTTPILHLEQSARDFAQRGHESKDFTGVRFEKPSIRTGNEVQSLADSIDEMATDIQNYVEEIFSVQKRAAFAEQEAESMTRLAYQDSLTRVKNKAAYLKKVEELQAQIDAKRAEFALAMYDLNNLKGINDTYGHDAGDRYIIGACSTICQIFKHSPVFRIGGDEFVAVLQGYDYEHRAELFAGLAAYFKTCARHANREPWECYSAAGGMAEYAEGDSFEQVFQRADEQMYRNKRAMKQGRRYRRADGAEHIETAE